MKYKLFRLILKVLHLLSTKLQVGNPQKKAPRLAEGPTDNEKIYGPHNGTDNIFIWRLNNILCSSLFSGAVINTNNLVYSRFITYPWGRDVHPVLSLPYLGKVTKTSDKSIFLITTAAKGNYYHWVVDLLPRLLLILKATIPDVKDREIILHSPKAKYEEDTLRLLGIRENKIVRIKSFELVHSKDLILSDFLPSYAHSPFPVWKKNLLDDFKQMVLYPFEDVRYNKIYLLRGQQKKRRLIGEEMLVEKLTEYGFHIVDPQFLTVKEQISVLAGADVVVALHGAALTNIIFCKINTLVIELRSKNSPPEFYSEIAKTCNLRFDSISLSPHRKRKIGHEANKEDLILTEESIDLLKIKLSDYAIRTTT